MISMTLMTLHVQMYFNRSTYHQRHFYHVKSCEPAVLLFIHYQVAVRGQIERASQCAQMPLVCVDRQQTSTSHVFSRGRVGKEGSWTRGGLYVYATQLLSTHGHHRFSAPVPCFNFVKSLRQIRYCFESSFAMRKSNLAPGLMGVKCT